MVTTKRALPKSQAKFPVAVLTRMTKEQAQQLDAVKSAVPEVDGRPAAVRQLIDTIAGDVASTEDAAPDAAEGKEVLSPDAVDAILDGLEKRTAEYSEMAKQVRACGYQLNTMTKLSHQMAKYGKEGRIPEAALEAVQDKIDRVLDRLAVIAAQDMYSEQVIRACRPR